MLAVVGGVLLPPIMMMYSILPKFKRWLTIWWSESEPVTVEKVRVFQPPLVHREREALASCVLSGGRARAGRASQRLFSELARMINAPRAGRRIQSCVTSLDDLHNQVEAPSHSQASSHPPSLEVALIR